MVRQITIDLAGMTGIEQELQQQESPGDIYMYINDRITRSSELQAIEVTIDIKVKMSLKM